MLEKYSRNPPNLQILSIRIFEHSNVKHSSFQVYKLLNLRSANFQDPRFSLRDPKFHTSVPIKLEIVRSLQRQTRINLGCGAINVAIKAIIMVPSKPAEERGHR